MIKPIVIAGDVDSNPGPTYNIIKLIKASFHQGNPMFGLTAGIRCACKCIVCYMLDQDKKYVSTGTHVIWIIPSLKGMNYLRVQIYITSMFRT